MGAFRRFNTLGPDEALPDVFQKRYYRSSLRWAKSRGIEAERFTLTKRKMQNYSLAKKIINVAIYLLFYVLELIIVLFAALYLRATVSDGINFSVEGWETLLCSVAILAGVWFIYYHLAFLIFSFKILNNKGEPNSDR